MTNPNALKILLNPSTIYFFLYAMQKEKYIKYCKSQDTPPPPNTQPTEAVKYTNYTFAEE